MIKKCKKIEINANIYIRKKYSLYSNGYSDKPLTRFGDTLSVAIYQYVLTSGSSNNNLTT